MTQHNDLGGGFEARLLQELRKEVDRREEPEPEAERSRRPRPRTLALAGGAVAAAGALAVVVPVLLPAGEGADPAFAIEEGPDGRVEVELTAPDPEALERALEDHGVATEVFSLPAGMVCDPAAFPAPPPPGEEAGESGTADGSGGDSASGQESAGREEASGGGDVPTMSMIGVSTEQDEDGNTVYGFSISPGDDMNEDTTLVLELAEGEYHDEDGVLGVLLGVRLVDGEVPACAPVDAESAGIHGAETG